MNERPPRYAYWLAGAAIAVGGAAAARLLAAEFSPAYQVPIWLTGCALIFVGLSVVSLGARHRLEQGDAEGGNAAPAKKDDAGRGEGMVIDELRDRSRRRGSGNGNGGSDDGGR